MKRNEFLKISGGLALVMYSVGPAMLAEFTPTAQRGGVLAIGNGIASLAGLVPATAEEHHFPLVADADLLDLLHAFPSVSPSLPGLLKSLDRLQPRLYSIASSSKAHPREVHLTVSAVRWDNNDRTRTGIGSCYLADFAKPGPSAGCPGAAKPLSAKRMIGRIDRPDRRGRAWA